MESFPFELTSKRSQPDHLAQRFLSTQLPDTQKLIKRQKVSDSIHDGVKSDFTVQENSRAPAWHRAVERSWTVPRHEQRQQQQQQQQRRRCVSNHDEAAEVAEPASAGDVHRTVAAHLWQLKGSRNPCLDPATCILSGAHARLQEPQALRPEQRQWVPRGAVHHTAAAGASVLADLLGIPPREHMPDGTSTRHLGLCRAGVGQTEQPPVGLDGTSHSWEKTVLGELLGSALSEASNTFPVQAQALSKVLTGAACFLGAGRAGVSTVDLQEHGFVDWLRLQSHLLALQGEIRGQTEHGAALEEELALTRMRLQVAEQDCRLAEERAVILRQWLQECQEKLNHRAQAEGVGENDIEDAQSGCNQAGSGPQPVGACRVCWKKSANVLLIPCRHLALCKGCEPQIDHCPLCDDHHTAALHVRDD